MAHASAPRLGTALSRKHYEDRRSNSTTSSTRSHMSDQESIGSFDPENEAIASTQAFHSPAVSRYGQGESYQPNHAKDPNHIIQGNAGSDSEVTDMSIEIGRGRARQNRIVEDSRNDDSVDLSSVFVGDYSVTCSPPDRPKQRVPIMKPNENAHGLRQTAQIRFASMASQKENLDPAPQPSKPHRLSETANKIKRKTLGEINTRAAEMYDGSILNNERPVNDAPATKTTRFARSKRNSSNPNPVVGSSTAAHTAESQSFLLPDLPNLSQLMSGKQLLTPLSKTRFAAHPALSQTPRESSYKALSNVPIPDDEKAIIISLDLLQKKVIELEASASEFQQIIEELRTSNVILKAERKELKDENNQLRQENQDLRAECAPLRESSRPEKVPPVQRSHKQRQASVLSQINDKVSQILTSRQDEDLFSLMPTESTRLRPKADSPRRGNDTSRSRQISKKSSEAREDDELNSRRAKKVVIEETATARTDRKADQRTSGTHNVTYISAEPPPSHYLFDLRKMMEVERAEEKRRANGTDNQNTAVSQPVLPRKSSMKDISHRISPEDIAETTRASTRNNVTDKMNQEVSQDITDQVSRPLSKAARRQSDPTATAASNTSRRRASSVYDENMTSAFIIPDITIAQTINAHEAAGHKQTNLTDAAQHLIHGINPHDATNCTICSRLTAQNNPSKTKPEDKKTVLIPIPSLISSHPVQPTADNPDPTLRPSQNPSIALAIVLKELTDQHSHIKLALASKQDQYAAADPRLSRRKRERLGREIEALLRKCENTAGMIYRLCDVAEGQRESGIGELDGSGNGNGGREKDWTDEEIEVTVQQLRDVVGVYGCVEDRGDGGSENGGE